MWYFCCICLQLQASLDHTYTAALPQASSAADIQQVTLCNHGNPSESQGHTAWQNYKAICVAFTMVNA